MERGKWKTKNGAELENLRQIMKSLQSLVAAFSLYRGENLQFDLLLQNLEMLLATHNTTATVRRIESNYFQSKSATITKPTKSNALFSVTASDATVDSKGNFYLNTTPTPSGSGSVTVSMGTSPRPTSTSTPTSSTSQIVEIGVGQATTAEDEKMITTGDVASNYWTSTHLMKPCNEYPSNFVEFIANLHSDPPHHLSAEDQQKLEHIKENSQDAKVEPEPAVPAMTLGLAPIPSDCNNNINKVGMSLHPENGQDKIKPGLEITSNLDHEQSDMVNNTPCSLQPLPPGEISDTVNPIFSENSQHQNEAGITTREEEVAKVVSAQDLEKESATTEAFKIKEVLRNIFKYSRFEDLKSFRRIDKLCHLEATKLIRDKYLTRQFHITDKSVKFYSNFRKSKVLQSASVPEFMDFVTASILFPCSNVELPASSLANNDVRRFFESHGEIVKSVELWNNDLDEKNQALLEDLLVNKLPNLEILAVPKSQKVQLFSESESAASPSSSPSSPSPSNKVELKKLKTLKLWSGGKIVTRVLSQILNASKKLESIHCNHFTNADFTLFLEMNKFSLVKFFKFDFNDCSNINVELYEKIAETHPEFREMNNIMVSPEIPEGVLLKIGPILTKCFRSSSKTLEDLGNLYPLGHIPCLKLPVFPHLENLRIFYKEGWLIDPGVAIPMLPSEVKFGKTFPHLSSLKICFDFKVFEQLQPHDIFAEQRRPLRSVKELIVWCTCKCKGADETRGPVGIGKRDTCGVSTAWIKYFVEMFPKITSAYFEFFKDFASAAENLWKLKDLEELTLNIELNDKANCKPFPWMDAAFTGFSSATVKKLYKLSPEDIHLTADDVKKLRVKPSIVGLQKLKYLSITFIDLRAAYNAEKEKPDKDLIRNAGKYSSSPSQESRRRKWSNSKSILRNNGILTHVSGLFGFIMCPQLDLQIKLAASQHYSKSFPFRTLQPFVPRIPFSVYTD